MKHYRAKPLVHLQAMRVWQYQGSYCAIPNHALALDLRVATRMHNWIAHYYITCIVIACGMPDQLFCYTSQEALLNVYCDQ